MKNNKISLLTVMVFLSLTSCGVSVPSEVNFTLADLGTEVNIHTETQTAYLESGDPDNYVNQHEMELSTFSNSGPASVHFSWTVSTDNNAKASKYLIAVSEDEIFDDNDWTVTSKTTTAEMFNLKVAMTYYWKVTAYYGTATFESDVSSFTTKEQGPRNIKVEGVENVRDLGGWNIGDEQIYKQGLIYRSAELNGDEDGLSAPTKNGKKVLLEQLKIKSEVDLRKTLAANNDDEVCGITSSPLGDTVQYASFPMVFGGSNIFTNASNTDSLKSFFNYLAEPTNYPIIFHCVRGTDRTGALSYVLGALCGMTYDQLLSDYLFSNFANINSSIIDERNISGTMFYPAGINNSAGDSLAEKAANYLINTVGISLTTIQAIQSILLADK